MNFLRISLVFMDPCGSFAGLDQARGKTNYKDTKQLQGSAAPEGETPTGDERLLRLRFAVPSSRQITTAPVELAISPDFPRVRSGIAQTVLGEIPVMICLARPVPRLPFRPRGPRRSLRAVPVFRAQREGAESRSSKAPTWDRPSEAKRHGVSARTEQRCGPQRPHR